MNAKLISIVVVVGALGAFGMLGFLGTSDSESDSESDSAAAEVYDAANLAQAIEFGTDNGKTMFGAIAQACNEDGILMPSEDFETLCTEMDGATTMDNLHITCYEDAATCISFSDFFSLAAFTLGEKSPEYLPEEISGALFLAGENLCKATQSYPCSSVGGSRVLNIMQNAEGRRLFGGDMIGQTWHWLVGKIKNGMSSLNFGCCTENVKIDFNGDTARCAADKPGDVIPSAACGECRLDGTCKDATGGFTSNWNALQGAKNFYDGASSSNQHCINTESGEVYSGNWPEIRKDVSSNCCYFHDLCLANANQYGTNEGKAKYMCDLGIAACNAGRRTMVGLLAPRKLWWGFASWLPNCSGCGWRGCSWCSYPSNYQCVSLQQLMTDRGLQGGVRGTSVNCGNHAWAKRNLGV